MSSFAKCFDVVSMVVDEATAQFDPIWRPNNEKLRILKQYCGVLDSLAEEFGGVSFDGEVDDIAMTIAIQMECQDMTIESQQHKYYSLAQRAISFGFSATDEGLLNAKFVFPSMWDKV